MNTRYLNHMIREEGGSFFIDGRETFYKTLGEVKSYINNQDIIKNIKSDIIRETYHDNKDKFITFIKEEHNIKVTNNILEQYIALAETKVFSIDPVVHKIREFNVFDRLIENKIHYILNDGSIVAISNETQEKLNTILESNHEALEFMKEGADNFLRILKVLEKE